MRKLGRGRLPARYRYTDSLQPEDWAWEFLRRNQDYQVEAEPKPRGPDRRPLNVAHWGLRFRRGPRAPRQ